MAKRLQDELERCGCFRHGGYATNSTLMNACLSLGSLFSFCLNLNFSKGVKLCLRF